ncbi:DUF4175 domain-containing protein [Kitasatospora sp. MBT63]|nr:DUF4175 domain-containing protein [Kitasatospora sp. MBT63]
MIPLLLAAATGIAVALIGTWRTLTPAARWLIVAVLLGTLAVATHLIAQH